MVAVRRQKVLSTYRHHHHHRHRFPVLETFPPGKAGKLCIFLLLAAKPCPGICMRFDVLGVDQGPQLLDVFPAILGFRS